jgi:hypothetical protein
MAEETPNTELLDGISSYEKMLLLKDTAKRLERSYKSDDEFWDEVASGEFWRADMGDDDATTIRQKNQAAFQLVEPPILTNPTPAVEANAVEHQLAQHPAPAFPTFWRLGGQWMSAETRERYYEPVIGELQRDFEDVKEDYGSKWAGRWLRFCFGFRTVVLIASCIRHSSQDGALGYLCSFLPETWRSWLKALFRLG